VVEGVNIGVRDRRDFRPANGRQDVGADLLPIDPLR